MRSASSTPAETGPVLPDRLTARNAPSLSGTVRLPGDKSISHRVLILAALAEGESTIEGLLEADDVLRTGAVLRAMGVSVERQGPGVWHVVGRGLRGLQAPDHALDFGNSGTGVRLMMGILAGQPFTADLTGDASLCRRPMARVTTPLAIMGARAVLVDDTRLPGRLTGQAPLTAIRYELPVPSAQVKSAVLLAGLFADGETVVVERTPTRDHTERLLARLGVALTHETVDTPDGPATAIRLTPGTALRAGPLCVPGDPSSAAFPLVAAAIVPGSRVVIEGMVMNPHRTGLVACLEEMGAVIERLNPRDAGGEPVADLALSAPDGLRGITVPAARAASMIDEYPALSVAAACAQGRTVMQGIGEMRVKESDRLAAMARGLAACGAHVEEGPDSLAVEGQGPGSLPGGAEIDSDGDHRIAMAFLVAGLAAQKPISATGAAMIATSFPGFTDTMAALGAPITAAGEDI